MTQCPVCRGSLTITPATVYELWHTGYHTHGTSKGLETRPRPCVIAACNQCEHIHEVRSHTMRKTTKPKATKAAKRTAKPKALARKPADQSWRKRIDWVAAGNKAFASRKRNERAAAKAAKAAASTSQSSAPTATPADQVPS